MPAFNSTDALYFMAFAVPGFISMQIYVQIRPREKITLKDALLEAVTFGAINFVLLFFAISWIATPGAFQQNPFGVWLTAVGIFLLCPLIWPWLLVGAQTFLARRKLFLPTSPTAWDHYFRDKRDCWVLVHVSDGHKIGGWFGKNSHASFYPEPGHLYVEEVWELDTEDNFIRKLPKSRGMLLRPGDYQRIEFFAPE